MYDFERANIELSTSPRAFDLTFRLLDGIDEFCTAHFLGWVMKALLVRHYGILWTISLMWEFTEMIFSHLLPNFAVSLL